MTIHVILEPYGDDGETINVFIESDDAPHVIKFGDLHYVRRGQNEDREWVYTHCSVADYVYQEVDGPIDAGFVITLSGTKLPQCH